MEAGFHVPVMAEECAQWLSPENNRVIVDATAGHGGHALSLASRMRSNGMLVLVDARPEALEIASRRVAATGVPFIALQGNFRHLAEMLKDQGIEEINGVLYDQGLSSADYEGDLGYSFRHDAPLDMRRDKTATRSAADLLATLSRRDLAHMFRELGDEKWADRIAEAIVEERQRQPINRTSQLVGLIERVVPRSAWPRDIHVATRCMMALRYAVNDDLGAIRESIETVAPMLSVGARIVCLSYCSTEDRVVKSVLRQLENPCICPRGMPVCGCGRKPVLRVLTKRGVRPSAEERVRNPRSRSAVARVAERIRPVDKDEEGRN